MYIFNGLVSLLLLINCVAPQQPWTSEFPDDSDDDEAILRAVRSSMATWRSRHQAAPPPQHPRTRRGAAAPPPSVCYAEYGCFEASGPFGYLDALPSPPSEISTTFLLWPGRRATRDAHADAYAEAQAQAPPGTEPHVAGVPDLEGAWRWASRSFNATRPTVVLVHGFGSSCRHVWVYEMRSAFMSVGEVNIVCVDWENGATLPNYVRAAANTRLVGKQLAMLLRGLERHVGIPRDRMHLIGFSLGAHVAGFAGSELRNISRITGLDPAGPLFELQDPQARLDSSDADFVDVIHSNGENLILGGLGAWSPMGHVDFYPNGGRMQKGCTNLFVGAVSDIIWSSNVEGRSLCNHRRAYKFFTDSISPRCHFPAFPCESYEDFLEGRCFPCTGNRKCGNMGYYADKSTGRGQLYLITRDEEPFCAHQYNVKIFSTPTDKPVTNYGKIRLTLVGDADINETFTLTKKDDEQLMAGEILSKILVPHPIIYEPVKVELLYQGYSGWLSSGLRTWKVDKISIMDSFGKMASVCRRHLELESGVTVTLKLYPGDCHTPHENLSEDDDLKATAPLPETQPTHNQSDATKFIPTTVVRIGDEVIGSNKHLEENLISRSLGGLNVQDEEVVEPVLKRVKNARSHDLGEISEPVLRSGGNNLGNDIPTRAAPVKRHDVAQPTQPPPPQPPATASPIHTIIMTVQLLPEKLSRMFEQAERYARETIFPLITQHTPRLLTTLIGGAAGGGTTTSAVDGAPPPSHKYVPLDAVAADEKPTEAIERREFLPPDLEVRPAETDPGALEPTTTTTTTKAPPEPRAIGSPEPTRLGVSQQPPGARDLTVNLPVFDPRDIGIKYIPLSHMDALRADDRIT